MDNQTKGLNAFGRNSRQLVASLSEASIASQLLDMDVETPIYVDNAQTEECQMNVPERVQESEIFVSEPCNVDVEMPILTHSSKSPSPNVKSAVAFEKIPDPSYMLGGEDSTTVTKLVHSEDNVSTSSNVEPTQNVRQDDTQMKEGIFELENAISRAEAEVVVSDIMADEALKTTEDPIATLEVTVHDSEDSAMDAVEAEILLQSTPECMLPPNYPPVIYPPTHPPPNDDPINTDTASEPEVAGVAVITDDASGMEDDGEDDSVSSEVSTDLRDDLEDAFQGDFEFKGNFYYAQPIPAAPNPCLNIDGLGPVGLPLSPRDAKLIIECATHAPFGHGDRTVINTDVRDTWEIEPACVKFDNPAWVNFVQTTVVDSVWRALGVAPYAVPPRCELYKLLLYESGSHFLPHQDTEKADGMFATVVILLPSPYTGGQVHVSHASSIKVIDMSSLSLISTSVLAWYTDVKHEVKPITSGYRLALSYNLIHAQPGVPRPALPNMHTALTNLRHVLRKWHKEAYQEKLDTNIIAYLLKHQYNTLNLQSGARTLKGEDAHMVTNLRTVADELGYMVCLGNMTYNVSGSADDDFGYHSYEKRRRYDYDYDSGSSDESTPAMGEVGDTTIEVKMLVDLDGNLLLGDKTLPLSEENLIPKDPFEDEEPDEKDYEGYMGNGAGSLDHWYHRTVLVLVHEDDAPHIFFKAGGIHYAIQKLKQLGANTPTADDRIIVDLMLAHIRPQDKTTAAVMSDYALKWKDLDMWKTVIKKGGSDIATFGADKLVQACKTFSFQDIRTSFEELLSKSKRLKDRVDFIQSISVNTSSEDQIFQWSQEQFTRAFSVFTAPVIEDIPALIAAGCTRGAVFLVDIILPQLVKNPLIYTFAVAFTKALHENKRVIPDHPGSIASSTESTQSTENVNFDKLVEQCLNTAVNQWDSSVTQPSNARIGIYHQPLHFTQQSRIIELVDLCILTGHMAPCKKLFLLLLKIQGTPEKRFQTIYTPLVPRLRDLLHSRRVDILSSPFADFLQLLVGSYLRDVLGALPRNYVNKIRKIGCGCNDCGSVDAFLTSNQTTEQTFRLAQARRLHIERRLSAVPDLVTFITLRYGSPHSLKVTKRPEIVVALSWQSRVAQAKAFLQSIGNDNTISKLMGNRYDDVLKALQGTQQFVLTAGDAARNNQSSIRPQIPAAPSALPSSLPTLTGPVTGLVGSSTTGTRKRKKNTPVSLGPIIDLTEDSS